MILISHGVAHDSPSRLPPPPIVAEHHLASILRRTVLSYIFFGDTETGPPPCPERNPYTAGNKTTE